MECNRVQVTEHFTMRELEILYIWTTVQQTVFYQEYRFRTFRPQNERGWKKEKKKATLCQASSCIQAFKAHLWLDLLHTLYCRFYV